eukprot:CAMPEP_0205945486 /NCGR_PEP_ID=MMETSP1325-20131115/66255_1 /ASSEMBLY_ACC=CAM_ASM_000708 /TAXON_ID=236786 /ORGANISM="Florenciella sp., Strain RCC1007" /LENGTH=73 /DNA_ID=CAMNT_0053316469 /DNA_START=41 /DNA_END=259 /DNA_ORIENTATION=+
MMRGSSPFGLGVFWSSFAAMSFDSRSLMSECPYTSLFFTPATLTASMMEAWFSASLITMSSLVRSVCTAEALA